MEDVEGSAYADRGTATAFVPLDLRQEVADAALILIATETGEAVPGDPQQSHYNILWAGFQEFGLGDMARRNSGRGPVLYRFHSCPYLENI